MIPVHIRFHRPFGFQQGRLSESFTGMFSNLLATPLTFRQVLNRFIHATVDFMVHVLAVLVALNQFR